MIYLITGIPGSGKTLYAVSTLIKSLMGDQVKNDQGLMVDRRLVVDGIPSLALPHEVMAKTIVDEKTITVEDAGQGVGNWWEWARPGDVIVIDEVQRIWRPRAMGSKPPRMVTELETHRHKGVDFILITQSPMLIDQNVRRLVGRHQHVRRLFGMARALIYDWDGCQSDVHRVASANKTMWAYPKSAYKLYASADVHTKQKQKLPLWALLPVVALAGLLFVGPTAYSKLSGAMTGKGVVGAPESVASNATDKIAGKSASAPILVASAPIESASEAISTQDATSETPEILSKPELKVAGCVSNADKCTCVDTEGGRVPPVESLCRGALTPALVRLPTSIVEANPLRVDDRPALHAIYDRVKPLTEHEQTLARFPLRITEIN